MPGFARRNWRARIETFFNRGLKPVWRDSPAVIGGRGLKQIGSVANHIAQGRFARRNWRARIETLPCLRPAPPGRDSPAVIGGRGLKPAPRRPDTGRSQDSPAVIGGRGLKLFRSWRNETRQVCGACGVPDVGQGRRDEDETLAEYGANGRDAGNR